MARSLQELINYLDNQPARVPLEELRRCLEELSLREGDLTGHIRFSDRGYARNLVCAGPNYHVWVMCWKNGQRSPIHDHAGSSCGVRVVRGALTETRFDFAPNGQVYATGSSTLGAGGVCATQDANLHQVSNLQAGSADLVTLHVYTPPLTRMSTYSLTGPERGEDVWQLEFCDAAGI